MALTSPIGTAFADPVRDAQHTFRQIMTAMAAPGTVVRIDAMHDAPKGIGPAMTAVLLTLCDYETPIWLDRDLTAAGVDAYARFHCAAPVCQAPEDAAFAFVVSTRALPDLASFAQGTLAYPDRSTTVVAGVDSLSEGDTLLLRGPGIERLTQLQMMPLPAGFTDQLTTNRARYPRGIDLLLCAGRKLVALPRTTIVECR
jgi:alpha-D-ribose 1-methylphosphonate 5-triphosphate synthase subunit PhnH